MKSFGLALLLFIALLAGCSSAPPSAMAGTWVGSANSPQGMVKATFTLDDNGGFKIKVPDLPESDVEGIYSVSGKELSLTATKLKSFEVQATDRVKEVATLSDDNKSFTWKGGTFTKQ